MLKDLSKHCLLRSFFIFRWGSRIYRGLYRNGFTREKERRAVLSMQKEILVVDDQPGIRLLLTDIFENDGYKVNTAETGQEALDKIYKNFFDLIILDYKLPILDGL